VTDSPDQLNTQILRLVATIRQMDQKIFRMSQCTSWPQMQPIFLELHNETMARMQDESRRIQTLLIPEIRKAYLDGAAQIEASPPKPLQLEGPKRTSDKELQVRRRKREK
jgi:hypothetical protein